jgi:hypothetical protein
MAAEPTWVSSRDIFALENTLDSLAAKLQSKRKEPAKTNLNYAIMLSVGIFVALFAGLSFTLPNISFGVNAFVGSSEAGSAEALQFSFIVAASGGIIPGVAYALLRDSEVRRKNEELASLGLEMKYLRSKILTLRQQEAGKIFDEEHAHRTKDKQNPKPKGKGDPATSFGDVS